MIYLCFILWAGAKVLDLINWSFQKKNSIENVIFFFHLFSFGFDEIMSLIKLSPFYAHFWNKL